VFARNLLAREVISLRQKITAAVQAGIGKNVISVEATAAPRRLLLQPGGALRARGPLQRCERNPRISDEFAPNCPQLSRSIEPATGEPARDLQNKIRRNSRRIAGI